MFFLGSSLLKSIYKSIHKSIRQGSLPPKVIFSRSLYGGYGNKLNTLLTSLVMAILSDSALLIEWKHISQFVQEPLLSSFYNASLNQTNNDFNYNYNNDSINFFQLPEKNAWKTNKNMTELIKTTLPTNTSRILYKHQPAYFFEICSNPIYYEKLHFYGLVKRETIDRAFEITNNLNKYSNDDMQRDILKIGFEANE